MVRSQSFRLLGILMLLLISSLGFLVLNAQDTALDEEVTEFTLTMTEYQFAVEGQELGEPIQLEAGKPYILHFINAGTHEHEVLLGQSAIEIAENAHLDFEESLLTDSEVKIFGVMNDAPFVIGTTGLVEFELNPGQELSIEFTLPEEKVGEWEIGCFVFIEETASEENPGPTHYDAAMRVMVSVVPAA
jgi:uncharacterized cupredoxin-like copper-binding protein